jgi:hypothetical protein
LEVSSCHVLGTTGGTTSSIDTSGANFIVVTTHYYGVTEALNGPMSLTENKSNGAPTALTQYAVSAGGAVRIYYWTNPTVGTGHTFTLDTTAPAGSNSYSDVCVQGYSGMATSSVFDSGTDSGANGGGTTCANGSITPSSGAKVVISGMVFNTAGAAASIDASMNIDGQGQPGGGTNFGYGIASLIQSTGATVNSTWTTPGTSGCAIAAFKGA